MDSRPSTLKGSLFLLFFTILMIILIGEAFMRAYVKYGRSVATVEDLKIYQTSTLVGWEHEPGALSYHGHGDPLPEVKINSYGMRDDEITLEKPENTVRIIFLGDSFTFGMGVSHKDTFSEILEDRLNREMSPKTGKKYEVLNMGLIGHTTDQEYLLLREEGIKFQPDIVVVNFFTGNDATELRRHEWNWSKNGDLISIKDVDHFVDDDTNVLRRIETEAPKSYLLFFVQQRWEILLRKLGLWKDSTAQPTLTWPNFLPPDHPFGDSRLPTFWVQIGRMLGSIKNLTDKNNIKLLLTAIPLDMQVDKKYWKKHPGVPFGEEEFNANLPQEKLKNITNGYGVSYLDLLPEFRDKSYLDTYWPTDDPHWTPEGHKLAADTIYEYLKNNGFLE